MDQASFLAEHEAGIGRLLGISYTAMEKDRVVATMRVGPDHYTRDGVVHGGIVMLLADCTGGCGAVMNLPPGHFTGTIESKTNFLGRGAGEELVSEARPVHVGRTTQVWRSTVSRGPGRPIAEVTQTQIVLPEPAARPAAAAQDVRSAEAPRGVGEDRKRRIFEGACKVIAAKGFAGATIREIAAAAGMPVPTMYQYIARKEDVLFFIYETFMQDYTDALRAAVAAEAGPAAKLEAAVRATVGNFDANHAYVKIMFQETRALPPEDQRRVYELDARYIAVWRELLEALPRDARSGEAELAANFIYFLCTVWPLRHWTIGRYGRESVEAALTRFIQGGLGLAPNRGP